MDKLIIIIIILVTAISSGLIGHKIGSDQNEVLVESDIQEMPDKNTPEILPDKNCNVEFEKAKEYYGKAFLLFLANIGISLNQNQKADLDNLIKRPNNFRPENVASNQDQEESEELVILPDFLNETSFGDYLKKHNSNIDHIFDKKMVKKNSNFILKDPGIFYVRSKFIKSFQKIKAMNGFYTGKLFLFVGKDKGEVHDLEMNLDYVQKEEDGDDIDGTFNLKISEDGNTYSNNNGRGGNGDMRLNNGSLIIEASPNTFFHFEKDSIDTANFYRNNELVGFARFIKND